jgi:hypothetical protein
MKADPEKANYWMRHIDALKTSGLSRKAYCEQNGLNKHTMDSWCQKLNPALGRNAEGNKGAWIPLQVQNDKVHGHPLSGSKMDGGYPIK